MSVKQAGAASAVNVTGIEAKTKVCESAKITNMTVTKQDNYDFETDSHGDLKVAPNTGGKIKIVLTGTNLDIDGAKAGVNFNGHDYEGTVNENGTELTIQNIPEPTDSGVYPIKAQLKPRYKTDYTILPDSYYGYKSKRLRVLGDVVLKELWLSGYDRSLENHDGWLVIKGENLDSLSETYLSTITSSLGSVTNAKVTDSVTLEATYIISDLPDDSVIGKTETLTVVGKPISSPLHTLKMEKEKYDNKYVVNGYYSIPSDGNLRIPAYVDTIRHKAFSGCTALTTIDLSATRITVIGDEVFYGCTGLTSIRFPQSLTRIGGRAFEGCTKLANAVFADTAGRAVYNDDKCESKHADIPPSDLQNPAKASEYLRCSSSDTPSGYSEKNWKKN